MRQIARERFLSQTSMVSGFLMILLSATLPTRAQVLSASIAASNFGYLDQYSMNTENSFVGDEACVPTSTTNGLTLLQNLNPSLFGTGLSGSTYEDWHATDNTLIQYLGTTANSGTSYIRIPYGITDYLNSLPGNVTSQITMSGQFSTGGWDHRYPQPSYITAVDPTAQFIYTAIQGQDAVLLSIDYSTRNGTYTSGGHELLASGITWDTSTNTGTIYFVDPLDSSATFSSGASNGTAYDQANAPAMITTGRRSPATAIRTATPSQMTRRSSASSVPGPWALPSARPCTGPAGPSSLWPRATRPVASASAGWFPARAASPRRRRCSTRPS